MTALESDKWSQLHDVAFLYLCCMHGTDAEIDASELTLVRQLLQERASSDDQVAGIMDDVMLMYVGRTGPKMLAASIASLAESMTSGERVQILQDLASIASADGLVYPNEVQFIVGVARQWGLEQYLSSD